MKRIMTFVVLATMSCLLAQAKPSVSDDKFKTLEDEIMLLQKKQEQAEKKIRKLSDGHKAGERKLQTLCQANAVQDALLDSLQSVCKQLEKVQAADRDNMNGKIDAAKSQASTSQAMLRSRTLWGCGMAGIMLLIITGVAWRVTRRIKSGTSTIDNVRKAQEALQAAQAKMQEESVKLDSQLLSIVQKQLETTVAVPTKASLEPDHSLIVKLAEEIARIETNLSKMDKKVRGYKQLVQAKDRMINNVRAGGYEIISLLGQEYNDGMQFQTRFVPDESLPEGKRIITGMIKMQVNYNGKMIQPAEIVVSQNI